MSKPTNHIALDGRLGSDVELRFTPNGVAVANFRIGHTPSRFDKQQQSWVDGETVWIDGTLWRDDAERLAEAASKGDLVLVTGALASESWDDRQTGEKRSKLTLAANTVTVLRKKGAGQQSGNFGQASQSAPAAQASQQSYDEPPF